MIHRAKKSLGQNFLKAPRILSEIIFAGEISKEDTVLEIGPGKGSLTEKLLNSAGKVIAVETDYTLFEFLKTKFEKEILSRKLELTRGSILDFDETKLKKYKIIANIPYNITGAILKKFLTSQNQPAMMVLMVQHEVAKRILSVERGEKESILSLSVKVYGTPKMVRKVGARFFSPQPKVNSAVIKISDISRNFFIQAEANEENFWKIVHAGFQHKRKKLQTNLKNIVSKEILSELGLSDKRAEDLSPQEWVALSKKCYN